MPLHKGLSFSNRYTDEKLINFIYHTNYCVIRGFLALRKAVTTQVKKFRTFLRQPPPPLRATRPDIRMTVLNLRSFAFQSHSCHAQAQCVNIQGSYVYPDIWGMVVPHVQVILK